MKAGVEGDSREWDGWMPSPTGWTWTLASSSSWRWTGKPAVHGVAKSQTGLSDWAELCWLPQSGRQGLLVNRGLEYWQPAARETPERHGKSRVKVVYQTHNSKEQSWARITKDSYELKHNNKFSKLTEVLSQPLKYRVNFWVKKLSREWSTQLQGAFSYGN